MLLQLLDTRTKDKKVTGKVYYGEEETVAVADSAADQELRDLATGLIGRLTEKVPPRKVPSASECRFCQIPSQYCPESIEP